MDKTLLKIFIIGIFLGAAVGAAGLYFVPLVDQERERSIIDVTPNGGNKEVFHANIPDDRIMIGTPSQSPSVPVGLDWPGDEFLANSRTELFKIRNSEDLVIGVASRIAVISEDGEVIEWALHLPARGSVYVLMQPKGLEDRFRLGDLRAGTREFSGWTGEVSEQWVAESTASENAPAGRIELITRFVADPEDES
jgi:hypothetical protein